jgi:hypothetical protein
MSHRIKREAPTSVPVTTNVPTVLPGTGWVCERTDEQGVRSVLPLIGWIVNDDGTCQPLPLDLSPDYVVRPRMDSDGQTINATAGRLRPRPNNQNWSPHFV